MNNGNSSSAAGWSLASILTLVFVVLKLTHNIDWSWWWVFSPALISLGFGLIVLVLFVLIVGGRR